MHTDVNHLEDFVNEATGGNSNLIEDTWTHAKIQALRSGGWKTVDSLRNDLSEFMWRRQKGLTATGSEGARQIFSKELPSLLYYRNYC